MSHSHRKIPIVGNAVCRSERKDKQLWHKRLRGHERSALAKVETEADGHMTVLENQVSQVWTMGKDGKHFFSSGRQFAVAQRIANQKGCTLQERSSLKKRLLHKWMGK